MRAQSIIDTVNKQQQFSGKLLRCSLFRANKLFTKLLVWATRFACSQISFLRRYCVDYMYALSSVTKYRIHFNLLIKSYVFQFCLNKLTNTFDSAIAQRKEKGRKQGAKDEIENRGQENGTNSIRACAGSIEQQLIVNVNKYAFLWRCF